jgi:hypothetical protein
MYFSFLVVLCSEGYGCALDLQCHLQGIRCVFAALPAPLQLLTPLEGRVLWCRYSVTGGLHTLTSVASGPAAEKIQVGIS